MLETLRSELLARSPLSALPEDAWRRAGALDTWGSNVVEGNTLSRAEVETLLLKGTSVGDRPVRYVLETIQHGHAFDGLLGRLDESVEARTVRDLHDLVFRGVRPDAGAFRTGNVWIRGSDHRPPRAEGLADSLAGWEADLREREASPEHAIDLAAWAHHAFEAIHPFEGGNGQVGRLLMNLILIQRGWPPVHVLPSDWDLYIEALEDANGGDLGKLVSFIEVAMARSLLILLDEVGGEEDGLKPLAELEKRGSGFVDYMAHEAQRLNLPAVRCEDGGWCSSQRAVRLYHGDGPEE